MLFIRFLIESTKKIDGLKIFASSKFVWDPLALFARIVEVKHGGHRIHPQAIDMILVEQEHRARHQETADLCAPVIKNMGLPVGMEALARIGVLVEMRAVEIGEPVSIRREVRGNPVEDHSDSMLVQVVDEVHEILWRAVTRSRREVSRRLVSPGSVKGMLHDGEKFNVGESQLSHILRKPRRHFAVRERTVVFFRDAHPRAKVNLVDRLRRAQRVALGTLLHPLVVIPLIVQVPDYGARAGRLFMPEADRIGLVDAVSVPAGIDVEFVEVALTRAGNKSLPNARRAAGMQAVRSGIPSIEVADD